MLIADVANLAVRRKFTSMMSPMNKRMGIINSSNRKSNITRMDMGKIKGITRSMIMITNRLRVACRVWKWYVNLSRHSVKQGLIRVLNMEVDPAYYDPTQMEYHHGYQGEMEASYYNHPPMFLRQPVRLSFSLPFPRPILILCFLAQLPSLHLFDPTGTHAQLDQHALRAYL